MATTFKNDTANGVNQMPVAQGAEIVVKKLVYEIAAALVINDIMHLGNLPAGHTMVDCLLSVDELDSGADAIVLEAGILNTAETDIDDTKSGAAGGWIGASTIAQAGGMVRATGVGVNRVPVDDTQDLPIGIHVSTAPGTGTATGTVELTVMYRSAQNGV